jgi:hypothetical protein
MMVVAAISIAIFFVVLVLLGRQNKNMHVDQERVLAIRRLASQLVPRDEAAMIPSQVTCREHCIAGLLTLLAAA